MLQSIKGRIVESKIKRNKIVKLLSLKYVKPTYKQLFELILIYKYLYKLYTINSTWHGTFKPGIFQVCWQSTFFSIPDLGQTARC